MALNPQLWQTNPIQYLLNDKFPFNKLLGQNDLNLSVGKSDKIAIQQVADFRKALEEKSRDEIVLLIAEARHREAERHRLHSEKMEAESFFNQPSANADFGYWSRISYWTLEEGVALSFGKNPWIVKWEKLKNHNVASPLIPKYAAKHEEVRRAKAMGQLWESTIPFVFIKWASRVGFEMPEELTSQVLALGVQGLDWKEAFEKEVVEKAKIESDLANANQKIFEMMREYGAALEKSSKDTTEISNTYQVAIEKKDKFIAILQREIDSLKVIKPLTAKRPKSEPTPRERESLLKLTLGMAIDGYGYDPKATKSIQIKAIADHLLTRGLRIDEDTVRKYLNEAKVLFADAITEQKN
jgi:hypothetical protein